jgi:hypothetical protein
VARSGLTLAEASGLTSYTGAALVSIDAKAHWVALRILSTHGGTDRVGLSEVRFYPGNPRGTVIMVK